MSWEIKQKDQRAWLSISDCQRGEHLACGITGYVSVHPHFERVGLSNVIPRRWASKVVYAMNTFLGLVKGD